jgi:hypothetical protein
VPASIFFRALKPGAAYSGARRAPAPGRRRARPGVTRSFRRGWGIAALLAVLVGTLAPPLHLAAGSHQQALTRRPRMEPRTAAAAPRVGRRSLVPLRGSPPARWHVAWLAFVPHLEPTAAIGRPEQKPDTALLSLAAPPPASSRAPPAA